MANVHPGRPAVADPNAPASPARRRLVRYGAMLAVAGQALARSGNVRAALFEARESDALSTPWPQMAYRTLGRTGFRASRLIFGCGATLASRPRDELLNTAFEAGVNVFDVGFRHYYDAAERHLAPFLKRRRDDVFLISKAIVPGEFGPDDSVSAGQARAAAEGWSKLLDESLSELGTDHVDAYYLMASNNPRLIASDEIHRAFERARAAGKVSYLGLSTHQNARNVLEAAIGTGRFDLAMIAITPGGWYDWETRRVLPGSPPMTELRPLLDRAREAGIGLIGMKAGRFLAGRRFLGWGNPEAFDAHYGEALLRARLSEFQRSYAYVLEHGLDAVNADMQSLTHLKENFVAAATSSSYFATA
jgi:aryl-alcohol dehydrogenase-like predicted oxidoreductase